MIYYLSCVLYTWDKKYVFSLRLSAMPAACTAYADSRFIFNIYILSNIIYNVKKVSIERIFGINLMNWEILITGKEIVLLSGIERNTVKGMKIISDMKNFAIILGIWGLSSAVLTGCGEGRISDSNTNSVKNGKWIGMEEIKEAVVSILGDNYWPDKRLTSGELKTETGIGEEMYDDFLAEKLNEETDIDIMIILKAKGEHLAEIETMLNAYRDALLVKYADRPQELGKVQASRIEVIDHYVCYVQLGADTGDAAERGDEEVLAVCQQENERAVDIIEKTILSVS